MNVIFLKILNMSISAGWLVLAVLILRFVLKKAPRWINVWLWGLVAVRLICPFSIESGWSLIPSAETIPMNIEMEAAPEIASGISAINDVVNPVISSAFTPDPVASANPLRIWIPLASVVWIGGMAVMLIYTVVSCLRLRRKVDTAVLYKENIFQSEYVDSPFVLGIVKPKIYLPFNLDGRNLEHVIAHEQAHINRKDHWWKPLGFLLMTIHWFNPLMWLAYRLLCRDIELACDEKVIRDLDNGQRADYMEALVACSVSRRSISACPLAFGEVSVKKRVVSIMKYKKPAFWIVILAVLACVLAAVCFLTDPKSDHKTSEQSAEDVLSQVFSSTLQEADDFEAYYETLVNTAAEAAETANEPGIVSVTGLEDYFQKQYGDLMTDECLEKMMENRIGMLIVRMARQYDSDIRAEGIELQERAGEQDMYDFNVRLMTVAGEEQIASVAGTIIMVQDEETWKASVLELKINNVDY